MVHSVMAVPTVRRIRRDERHPAHSGAKNKDSNKLFETILEEASCQPESAPGTCRTTLYDRESRLQNFCYLKREYHY